MITPERVARFWAKVNRSHPDECWLWTAAKDGMGYGLFGTRPSRCERAHRVSWVIAHGPIEGDLCVLHRCDTPSCVNPAHLFLGDRDANMADRQRKARQARGERSGRAVLTADIVRQARRRHANGHRIADIAASFGVNPRTLHAAVAGQTWSHIT